MNNALALSSLVIKELYRRKDFYVLFILTAIITVIMGSINVFNLSGLLRQLQHICLLLIWISSLVIALATAARQIPAERENRTIFPLMAKPVTRWEVVLGKFLGCWLACGIGVSHVLLVFRDSKPYPPWNYWRHTLSRSALAALVVSRHRGFDGIIGIGGLRGAILEYNDHLSGDCRHSSTRPVSL